LVFAAIDAIVASGSVVLNTTLGMLGRHRSGVARVVITESAVTGQDNRTARLECVVLAVFVDRVLRYRNKRAPWWLNGLCGCGIKRDGGQSDADNQ
jgi:hypothetical protein